MKTDQTEKETAQSRYDKRMKARSRKGKNSSFRMGKIKKPWSYEKEVME